MCKALGTKVRAVAKRRLEKLLASPDAKTEDVKRAETFAEAAERAYAGRIAEATDDNKRSPAQELAQLRAYALPQIAADGRD